MLPVLVKEEIGVLGMKPIANGLILRSKTVSPVDCLRYALNLPTSVVINGCSSMELLEQALGVARSFKPLTQTEVAAMLAKTFQAAQNGEFELYKNTNNFDGTIQIRSGLARVKKYHAGCVSTLCRSRLRTQLQARCKSAASINRTYADSTSH